VDSSTSSMFGILNVCSVLSLSSTLHRTVPFHFALPFDSEMPCILTFIFERINCDGKGICVKFHSFREDAYAFVLIITGRLVRHSASLSLVLLHLTVQFLWIVLGRDLLQ
jgi:hypothetical protein